MRSRSVFLLGFGIFFIDRVTKLFAQAYLPHTTNTGAAFGLFPSFTSFLTLISFLAVLVFAYLAFRSPSLEIGFLFGGTLGNFYDRLFFGKVIDFIDLGFFPSFNYADFFLSIAICLLIYRLEFMHFQE